MTRNKAILTWLLLGAPFPVMGAQGRYPIGTDQIAATINRYGIGIAPGQVKLLSGVVATTTAPRLTVRSIQPWGNERMMARIECESREQCLPFLVGLELGSSRGSPVDTNSSQGEGAGTNGVASPKEYVLRKGATATLQLDGEHVHIRISVICLENGGLGQTIRVTGSDHRLVYAAKVVDGGLLQGKV